MIEQTYQFIGRAAINGFGVGLVCGTILWLLLSAKWPKLPGEGEGKR